MKLLVTGRSGQVAQSLAALAGTDLEIVALGRPELDITDRATIEAALAAHRPDLVVSAGAYTAVDRAESEEAEAFAANRDGAGHVAAAAAALGLPVLHLSTDYVFAGDAERPYREADPTGPASVYGRSKLAGEAAVLGANPRAAIFRTAWVYSPFGHNFLKTMLRLCAERDTLRVVADQRGTPTYAPDIAAALVAAARTALAAPDDPSWRGLFHLVAQGETTWAGFAEEIFRQSAARGGPSAKVEPIATADYPTPAQRPANSRLDSTKFQQVFGHQLPPWQTGVERCLESLAAGSA
ncbi:NAD(P)-dependent oxidoreductase [Aureimonas endophytica]|uniref:dTDP-4-dehydrorhamnose reductase n=1 Tax=Aureimonas endophytica TaxID=2027858 RepID=A0A916ZWH4_9HYPH|nr:dTDP-4-dehydrorhamnose reductase [Aureimonas endophytica]GGE15967.1 NAD(P)-dependent oxidoreductase [Aureimonas endophytica]